MANFPSRSPLKRGEAAPEGDETILSKDFRLRGLATMPSEQVRHRLGQRPSGETGAADSVYFTGVLPDTSPSAYVLGSLVSGQIQGTVLLPEHLFFPTKNFELTGIDSKAASHRIPPVGKRSAQTMIWILRRPCPWQVYWGPEDWLLRPFSFSQRPSAVLLEQLLVANEPPATSRIPH